MADQEQIVYDGTTDFSLGQDAYHYSNAIQDKQYASAVNVIPRGSVLQPRPAFIGQNLTFQEGFIVTKFGKKRTYKELWQSGKFQAAIPYNVGPDGFIISIISGFIFRTNIASGFTILLTPDIKVNQFVSRINWSFADTKIVLFDYPNYPVVVDNLTVFRCSATHEVNGQAAPQIPISTLGTYNQNRLFIADAGVQYTASDAVGNLATPEAPITFTEVFTPSSPYVNQFFSLPTGLTLPITAMGFIQELDTSTGVGPLFIGTAKQLYFVHANQPRANWTQDQFAGLLLNNAGMAGARSFVNVNSDLIFMNADGQVHALSNARNEAKKWGNIPISREVRNYLTFSDLSLARLAVIGYFQNYLFITANPFRTTAYSSDNQPVMDYAHGGLVILDIENLASFLTDGTPVWDGLWTGINPVEVVVVNNRCFFFSKDGGGNAIYELDQNQSIDLVRGRKRQVRSIVYLRQYEFGDSFALKREKSISVKLQNIAGNFTMIVDRKPTQAADFSRYGVWTYNAKTAACNDMPPENCYNGFAEHQFLPVVFGDAIETPCHPVTGEQVDTFVATQLRLIIEGDNWLLDNIRMKAVLVPYDERQFSCEEYPETAIPAQCLPDWIIPDESLCQSL